MDKALHDKGLEIRRKVLGDEYVDRAVNNANDFNRHFQEVVTEYCWGMVWGSEQLDHRTRSILNLGMLAALNRPAEFEIHFRGALRNGCTKEELRDVLEQITVYCGVPAGVEAFRIARRVFDDLEQAG